MRVSDKIRAAEKSIVTRSRMTDAQLSSNKAGIRTRTSDRQILSAHYATLF